VDWIDLAEMRIKLQTLVNKVIDYRITLHMRESSRQLNDYQPPKRILLIKVTSRPIRKSIFTSICNSLTYQEK
jgi:hypothetical protein